MSDSVEHAEIAAARIPIAVEQRSLVLAELEVDDQDRVAHYVERASAELTLRAT